MKKAKIISILISIITLAALWINYSQSSLARDDWRTNVISGYQFEEAPNYFAHLEKIDIQTFVMQELLILTSGLLLIFAIKKEK